jgi:hypothetical protein
MHENNRLSCNQQRMGVTRVCIIARIIFNSLHYFFKTQKKKLYFLLLKYILLKNSKKTIERGNVKQKKNN